MENNIYSNKDELQDSNTRLIPRRKLLASLAMAGGAVAAGSVLNNPVYGQSVIDAVYGNGERNILAEGSSNAFFNVKDFGALGDCSKDDTAAIQACVNAAMENSGLVLFPGKGPYLISSPITIRQPKQTTDSSNGVNVHFINDMRKITILSFSQAVIKAAAPVTSIFVTSTIAANGQGTYSNFYTEFYGLHLDGDNLATNGINIIEAMHTKVERCNINKVQKCIVNSGYGVHQIIFNVLYGTVAGVDFTSGGDSLFMHNDIFVEHEKNGIIIRPWGGNTTFFRNIFTSINSDIPNSESSGIYIKADNSGDEGRALATTKILCNSFDGMKYGVKTKGFSSRNQNVFEIEIFNN